MKIAVIGAGISGLTCARQLSSRGHEVVVFEREETPGGLVRCQKVDGSLFHTCGGHVFNSKRQDVFDFFWSHFNKDMEFTKAERNSVVYMQEGLVVPYPIENHMYMFDENIQKKFIGDLVTLARREGQVPDNFEDFLRGRFGETLYELYFRPYNEKVWRRNLRNVPISWLEGKLPMPSVEEIIFNNINHIEEKAFVHSSFWYAKNNGSQHIADKLAEGLQIEYHSDIDNITYDAAEKKWQVYGRRFDSIVYCGNINEMVHRIDGCNLSDYMDAVDALEYHGTTAVFCEIDKNPYSWIYMPGAEHESHRIICTGNFAARNNKHLRPGRITATIEFTDFIEKEQILENLKQVPFHPKYLAHQFNKYTYPIQDKNTRELIKHIKSKLKPYRFYFTGRFCDWEYYNMDVAMGAAIDMVKNSFE